MDRQKCLIFSFSKEKRSHDLFSSHRGNRSRLVHTKSRGADVYPLRHEPKQRYRLEINTISSHAHGTHRSFAHDL